MIYTPDITVSIYWAKPHTNYTSYINIQVEIKLVALDDNTPGQDAWFNEVYPLSYSTGIYGPDSGTWTENPYFAASWSVLGAVPAGVYEIKAVMYNDMIGGDIVATARSTFHFVTSSCIKSFSVNPTTVKVDLDNPLEVTLSWETVDASYVSIDQGVGDVAAEGSMKVSPIEIELPNPASGQLNFLAVFTLTASSGFLGLEETATVSVIIQPLTFDEIFNAYKIWGNTPHTWVDGSYDAKPLEGPTYFGSATNFLGGVTNVVGYSGFTRYGCQALQYKTLVFLNELESNDKLIGWDYMPIRKIFSGTESIDWVQHNAVVISQYGKDWRTGYVLDSHPKQTPAHFPVDSGWRNDWSDLQTAYGDVYPGIPGGSAAATGKLKLNNFNQCVENYYNARTPWGSKITTINIDIQDDGNNIKITVNCPVNVLVTNSAGQRLGMLPNNEWVFEFKPLDAYYWSDENGDKQWYFSLPNDTYDIDFDGTESGVFDVITYAGGDNINGYGDNPTAPGQRAVLSIEPGVISELTLDDGTKVVPETRAIASYVPTDFVPTPATTPTPASNEDFNWALLVGAIGGLVVLLLIITLVTRKPKQSQ
ncbi:MAG: hypothetical protein PHG35_09080 [Dehalococcoidales bacterium]|nr:hypothetical protein [Dehalococcoidales bacterium]